MENWRFWSKIDVMVEEKKEYFSIKGLSGKKTLSGEIPVRGSKNAVLPLLASCYLFSDSFTLKNIPDISDVRVMKEIIEETGVSTQENGKREFLLNPKNLKNGDLRNTSAKKLRASVILSGPILARFGEIKLPHPGGCVIGARPIDFFIEGFKKMGAKTKNTSNYYHIKAPDGELKGAKIFFKIPSVTATETFMMAGVLAKGKTTLKNAAMEPEIIHLAEFLKKYGAKIKGEGTPTIEITGGKKLKAEGNIHQTLPDRLEAGSFLILGALAADNLEIKKCKPQDLEIVIEILKEMGVPLETEKDKIIIKNNANQRTSSWKTIDIKTHEYPGFPTDLQPPMTVLLTQVLGEALVFETIFENRLNWTEGLARMGADITMCDPHRVIVKGPTPLKAKVLEGPDIRAGLAFLIAAVVANGNSVINNIHYIDRGYEKVEDRLKNIGLNIDRNG